MPGEPSPTAFFATITRHLRRKTSSGAFIPEVDGLRFVAIATVVVFHLSGYLVVKSPLHAPTAGRNWLAVLASTGECGVHLFFMISGFILALPWLSPGGRVELKPYFLRRLTRLEPPYLLSLLLITLAYAATKRPLPNDLSSHALASAVYAHGAIFAGMNPANCVLWSLESEVQFYVLLPLLARMVFRAGDATRRTVLFALVLLGCAVSYGVRDSARLSLSLLGVLPLFVTGILIADFHRSRPSDERSTAWDLLGIVGFAMVPVVDLLFPFVVAPLILPLVLVFVSALRGRFVGRVLSHPGLVIVGGMCYSIYLLHYPLISFVGRYALGVGESFSFPFYLATQILLVTTAIAGPIAVFFICVERPCMDRNWPTRLRAWSHGLRHPEPRIESGS